MRPKRIDVPMAEAHTENVDECLQRQAELVTGEVVVLPYVVLGVERLGDGLLQQQSRTPLAV